jgi:ankyrin repeat protein/thioredoxin-like negative regulator of GroEL
MRFVQRARCTGIGVVAALAVSGWTASAAPTPPRPAAPRPLGVPAPGPVRERPRDGGAPDLSPDQAAARADDLLGKGEQGVAEDLLFDLAPRHRDHARLVFLLGACIRSRFQVAEAAPVLAHVATLAPESKEGLCAALILHMDADHEAARAFDALRLLIELNPDDLVLRWMLAVQCRARNSNHEGVLHYGRLAQVWRPGPVLMNQTYANLLDAIDSHEQALARRRVAVGKEREHWSVSSMAITLMDLERYDEAEPLLREAIQAAPDRAGYRSDLGVCLRHAGRYEAALDAFREANGMDPSLRQAWSGWIETLIRMDRPGEALDKCTEMRKAGVRDPWVEKQVDYLVWHLNRSPEGKSLIAEVTPGSRPTDSVTNPAARAAAGLALIHAASAGSREAVKSLLAWGADIGATNDHGCTALHHAAEYGHPEIVADLVKAGAQIEARNQWRQTPLYVATHWLGPKNVECARVLIEAGADPNTEAAVGSALRFAIAGFNHRMAELLVKAGGTADGGRSPNGATPLTRACGWTETRVARWLVRNGADPNSRDNEGRTPLMHTFLTPLSSTPEGWSPDLLALLIRAKADPNLEDKSGATALDWAAYVGHGEAVDYLVRNGAARHAPRFPRWQPAPGSSDADRFALACHAPLLCFTGGRLGIPGGLSGKQPAMRQLKDFWGLATPRQLRARLSDLGDDTTEAGGRSASNAVPEAVDATTDPAGWVLRAATAHYRTHGLPGRTAARAPANARLPRLAWNGIHRLHLAALGRTAEWLPPADAKRILDEAAAQLGSAFGSWAEFATAVEFGQRLMQPRDSHRYQFIFTRLADGADPNNPWVRTPWPKRGGS